MDALKIQTLEEDNVYLRGQLQLLQSRNEQLEARIAQLSEFFRLQSTSQSSLHPFPTQAEEENAEESNSESPTVPFSEQDTISEPLTPTAASFTQQLPPSNKKHHITIDVTALQGEQKPRSFKFTSELPTPVSSSSTKAGEGSDPGTPIIRIGPVPAPRSRSKSAAPLPSSFRPPRALKPPTLAQIYAKKPELLKRIFRHATNITLPSTDPFLQDSSCAAWNESVELLKSLALVCKAWYTPAIELLYKNIRLRRIPQLSVLVSTLEHSQSHPPAWVRREAGLNGSSPKGLGFWTSSLDLSFYIPPEWNNLYAEDVRRLIACVPNLQSYRCRPMLPIFGSRPVPTPIVVCLADTRNELLTELELSEQEGPQMTDLIRLLQSCTYLERLSLGKYVFEGGLSPGCPVLRLQSLKELELKVTSRLTPGSFASLPSPHVLAEAAKWDLPKLESLTLVLYDQIRCPFPALGSFLNIHGHKIKKLVVKEADPLMRVPQLVLNGIISRCPELEELTFVGSATAPLAIARAHSKLKRITMLGMMPGEMKMGLASALGGVKPGGSHLWTFAANNREMRNKFPSLKELVIQDDATQPLAHWQKVVGSTISVLGPVNVPRYRGGSRLTIADFAEDDEDDEEDEDYEPDEEEGSDEEDEDGEGFGIDDDELDDDETVKDSRSGRGRDDDQVDHTTALLIFQNGLRAARAKVRAGHAASTDWRRRSLG